MPSKGAPTRAEFDAVLCGGEGQFVEFKEAASDSLARELVALANSGGGRVYVGIADDRSVKGVQVSNRMLSQVQDIARGCDPPVKVGLVPFAHAGRQVLMIHVPDGDRKPYGCSAGYFLRTGPNSQKMNRDELVRFVRRAVQVEFDAMDCADFVYPRDFDGKAFDEFVRRAGISAHRVKREAMLANLGVARSAHGSLHINNTGALFFAKDAHRHLPQSEVTCVLYRDVEGVHIIDRKDFRGPLLANLDDTGAFLRKHIAVRYEIKSLYRKEITELPEDAWREAVINALMHRDYHFTGARIMVQVFPDRLQVSNPGGLPPGMDPRQFGHVSVHRNRRVADLLHRAGLVERIGSGIGRMREAMRAAGLSRPRFEFGSFFVVTFRKAATPAVQAAGDQVGTKSALSRHQVEALQSCRKPRSLVDLLGRVGMTDRTKFRNSVVRPLVETGLMALTIPGKPRSRFQKYVTTGAGRKRLAEATS